ncbi:iron uptake porin [Chroococcus sp. FPU101]|uniref:iron uptake porin n=1 Tax=Chroococcus sp. FPU101 TaxID=1974212 RepID=UPI001A8E22C3|nr:iron uptake porin [Chroococcus sp. FPU101]GFE71049.1 probable porin; major outer membrane protein [Chroococcus sp. FPU101]
MRFHNNSLNYSNWLNLTHFGVSISLSLGMAIPVLAEPQFNPITGLRENFRYNAQQNRQPSGYLGNAKPTETIEQVTSVSELKDVEPTSWAFEALRSLVERYGCIVGYPDRTYRGNRALTRWEFAAGLNACLNTIERLIQDGVGVLREDIDKLTRLMQEFESELAALGTRIDNIESRVAYLEDHQFSTTTKLNAQVIWSINDTFGDAVGSDSDKSQTQFSYRIRMNFESSFTGKDLLRTRLQMGNFGSIGEVTGTNMTRLNYDDNSNNQVQVAHLFYITPINDYITLRMGPVGVGYTDITDTITPPTIADDALGIPSRFGEYNLVYRRGGGGGAINLKFVKNLELTLGYLAEDAQNPGEGTGLFNGTYHALAQLALYGDNGAVGFAYSRSYFPAGQTDLTAGTGSFLAVQPFGDSIATSGDFLTLQAYYRITPNIQIHGWGGYINADAHDSGLSNLSDGRGNTIERNVRDGDHAELWYGAVGVSFPDIGGEGFLPGILFGVPPTVTNSDVREDRNTAYHLEAFYRLQLNDYIAVTPGFWVIFNPENDSRNSTQWVGHIRTSFNF